MKYEVVKLNLDSKKVFSPEEESIHIYNEITEEVLNNIKMMIK
jgi:hypothetical protein